MERKRYIVGVVKIPYADRDVAHDVITSEDLRGFLDIVGADSYDDDEKFPIGSNCTYSVELTEAEVERFRAASNCRYVVEDEILTTDANNVTYAAIPSETTMRFMEADFPRVDLWHGRDVKVAILDGGTSAPVRNYMKWTLVDRKEYQNDPTGPDEVTTSHGCLVAPNGVPYGGLIMDLIIANDDGTSALSGASAGMRYAADNGAKVLNYSYSSNTGSDSPVWTDVFNYMQSLGANTPMIFCSAGNDGLNRLNYPSGHSRSYWFVHSSINVVAETGLKSASSNYHADGSGCAPGNQVVSLTPTGDITTWNGTSASTPHTASLAARALTGGRFTIRQVSDALKANTRDLGTPASDQGHGAVSLLKTLTALGAFSGTAGQLANLSPNPAAKTATTGWTGGSGGTRLTGLSGMNRATGFGSLDYIITPRAACTAGQPVFQSLDVVTDTTETLTGALYFFNSSGSQIGTGASATFSATANIVQRITRTATAPTGAAFASLYVSKPASASPTGTVLSRWVGISDSTALRIRVKTSGASTVQVQATSTPDMSGTKFLSGSSSPDGDGYTMHNITGLAPGTQYYYRVLLGGGAAAGTFKAKTAPVAATSFQFSFGSCTNASDSDSFTAILARNPDFHCDLGDKFYADGTSSTVANYKAALAAKVSAAKQGALLSNVPSSYTWSDHDFGFDGNAVGTENSTRTGNANTAYRAVVPTPALPASGIYYSWSWGRVKFIQLDERTFKDANNKADTVLSGGGGTGDPGGGGGGGGSATYPMDIMPDYWYLTTPEKSPFKDSTWNIYNDGGNGQLDGFPAMGPTNPDIDSFVRTDTNGTCNPPGGASSVPAANAKRQFKLNTAKDGIIMIADYDGYTTPNSDNTRMEFREQISPGYAPAKWSTSSGTHRCMIVTQIDRHDNNHIVIGQIHGASDDVTVFRLEGSTIWRTAGNTAHGFSLDTNYTLGTPIVIGFSVQGNSCDYYYYKGADAKTITWDQFFVAGNKKNSYSVSDSGCYFKAGNYLQRKGSAGSWSQVTLYKALVSHTAGSNGEDAEELPASPNAVGPPWTKNYPDGTGYPVISGGTSAASASSAAALSSAANGSLVTYTGSAITSAVTISGKSNITFKNIKVGSGGSVTLSGCTNIIIDNAEALFDPTGTTPIFQVRGAYEKVKFINCLFGSASASSGGGSKARYIQFGDSGSVGSSFGVVERCTFRNKNNPGNCIHTVGDTGNSTGGVRYTLVTHCLFQGTKPFDENDHESCLMGISSLQLTNGQQVIEHCRFEDCWSEPEVISMKMNWSRIRGCVFYECCGSASLRHGDDGEVNDCFFFGDKDIDGPQSYNRTSAGPRLYGARHKIYNNTIRVNGNGGSIPSATSMFETPLTLDSGDVAPGSTSNGHGNIVGVMVEKNLLVRCGNPIMVTDNYGTAPTGTVRNNKIVECANAPSDGVRAFGASPSKAGLTISGNTVYATVSAAGLALGSNPGEYRDPTGATGARVNYLTASMVGRGSTYDAWSVEHGGGGVTPPPSGGAPTVDAGTDATIIVNNGFTRTANESGDNITARQWQITAGPTGVGTVLSTSVNLSWTPTVLGNYTLVFSATNNVGTSSDSTQITVSATAGVETGTIPNKTILGATQRQWLKDQITNATEPVIIVLGDTVWLGPATSEDDEYFAYNVERQNIADFITASGKNVIRLGGDMHAVAVGSGLGYKKVWQAAPFNNAASIKGSGWTQLYPA